MLRTHSAWLGNHPCMLFGQDRDAVAAEREQPVRRQSQSLTVRGTKLDPGEVARESLTFDLSNPAHGEDPVTLCACSLASGRGPEAW